MVLWFLHKGMSAKVKDKYDLVSGDHKWGEGVAAAAAAAAAADSAKWTLIPQETDRHKLFLLQK